MWQQVWVERNTPQPLRLQPCARCRGRTWALAWPGRWDTAPEGAAPAQGMHRSAQVPTYRAPHIVLPGTYMTPAPSQQKLLQLHGTCPGKVVSQLHAQRCRSRKKDNPKGFQIGVRALLLVSVELRTSISKHPSHTITSQDMQLPTALAARHR